MEKCPLCGAPGCALFVGFCCNNTKCTNYVPDKNEKDICEIFMMGGPERAPAEWSKALKRLFTNSIIIE